MRKLSVSTGMSSRLPKPTPQAKRVTPPAVPDVYRLSGSSFGSAGYSSSEDGAFLVPPDTPNELTSSDQIDYDSSKNSAGINTSYIGNQTQFPFPVTSRGEPLTHKAAVFYHQQLALQEDQGIDLTQSPGRDSPGSSSGSAGSGSRHSTASLDSGRASSYLTASTRGALSSPRCSVSSCSIGSVDRMSQRSQDHELILDWLMELHFEEYAQCFSSAGYDLPTITRMTPEDLTAIGIKNPHHRERIKQHIDTLQLPDSLPNYVPGSIEEWLRILRLEEYIHPLLAQGYQSVRDVTQLIWEDLEDIGIVKLGHQKKILLAIKRVKDISSGKWIPPPSGLHHCQQQHQIGGGGIGGHHIPYHHQYSSSSGTTSAIDMMGSHPQSWGQILNSNLTMDPPINQNDIVLIELRQPRGKSLESLEDLNDRISGTHLTFSRAMGGNIKMADPIYSNQFGNNGSGMISGGNTRQYISPNMHTMPWRRSYDDGDITPTNDIINSSCDHQGGGTLPRHHRGSSNCSNVPRFRPVAKVQANVASMPHTPSHIQIMEYDQENLKKPNYITGPSPNQALGSPDLNKKQPPEPPRRQSSSTNAEQMSNHFDALSLSPSAVNYQHQNYYHLHQMHQQQSGYNTNFYANIGGHTHQTTVEVHAEKFNDSKSNSSIDSIDILPFANENAGTIKQRALNRQDLTSSSLSSSSSSSSSSATTIAGQQCSSTSTTGGNAGGIQLNLQISQSSPTSSNSSANSKSNLIGSNVLNDIGHMLANLTDELDAMLEEEKRAGLNDSD